QNLGAAWDRAVIADFNADGRPDVAASSSLALDVAFFDNAGEDGAGHTLLNPSTIATNGLVERLTVGDFDGDLVNDLAFTEAIDQGAKPFGYVSVAFGAPLALPRTV